MISIDYARMYGTPAPPAPAPAQPPAADPLDAADTVAVQVDAGGTTVYRTDAKGAVHSGKLAGAPSLQGGGFKRFFRKTFLPSNYPTGVHPDYGPFRKWSGVGNFAQAGIEFFATQGILAGLGLSVNAATTATIAYFAKDAFNWAGQMVGGALARRADVDPTSWYLRANAIQSASRLAQSALIIVPGAFWVLAPVTNASKAMASALEGAASANIDNHQALGQNVGELKAKNGNQNLVTSGIGSGASVGLSVLAGRFLGPWGGPVVAAGFTALNIYASKKAADALQMDDLTSKQMRRLVHQQLATGTLLSPRDFEERAMRKIPRELADVKMGAELEPFVTDAKRFERIRGIHAGEDYLVDTDGKDIRVALSPDADLDDQARAMYQSHLLSELLVSGGYEKQAAQNGHDEARLWAVEMSYRATPSYFSTVLKDLKDSGWETTRINMEPGDARVRWKPVPPASVQYSLSLGDFQKLLA